MYNYSTPVYCTAHCIHKHPRRDDVVPDDAPPTRPRPRRELYLTMHGRSSDHQVPLTRAPAGQQRPARTHSHTRSLLSLHFVPSVASSPPLALLARSFLFFPPPPRRAHSRNGDPVRREQRAESRRGAPPSHAVSLTPCREHSVTTRAADRKTVSGRSVARCLRMAVDFLAHGDSR